MGILVGSDPEVMLEDLEGRLVNALDVVPGRKGLPTSLSSGDVIADNVNIEFNHSPTSYAEEFSCVIREMLHDISREYPHLRLRAQTSAVFEPEQMQNPESYLFGCDPEFDGWTGVICPPPKSDSLFRSCGGHVHIGSQAAKQNPLEVIRSMDLYVGLGAVVMDNDTTSPARQRLYGGAGKFRTTSYGVEYRTPGNFWLSRPELAETMHALSTFAVQDYHITPPAAVRDVIRTHNKRLAYQMLKEHVQYRIPKYMWNCIEELANTKHNTDIFASWGVR